MEIYKLKDEISEGLKRGVDDDSGGVPSDGGFDEGLLKITKMKQGVKNPNRVNVFVNNEFAFSLDVAQVVDFKLKVGKELSFEELEELKRASEFGKLYQRALEWVLMRPRSIRETRDYLIKKLRSSPSGGSSQGASPSLISSGESFEFLDTIISQLLSKGYLDDRRFAEFWVQNRFVKKGVSQKRLAMELTKKGVAKNIIEEVLGGRDEEEELRKMIAKKRSRYDDPEKLMVYLCRQGFSYELVRKVMEEDA